MNFERIVATNERGLVERSCDYIEQHVREFQDSSPTGSFVLGLAGPNGRVRRERALDTYTELASRRSIDWSRMRIFVVDERYGFETEEDSNAYLVRKAFGRLVPADALLVPDTSLPTLEEAAADYEVRLTALLKEHAPDGPHLSTLSLQSDGSVASVFPEWYLADPSGERWRRATPRHFGVLCTSTATFECPERIAVNLRVVKASKTILLFTGEKP